VFRIHRLVGVKKSANGIPDPVLALSKYISIVDYAEKLKEARQEPWTKSMRPFRLNLSPNFFLLFHWVGPRLREQGASWWIIFQCLLVAPLGCMLVAPFALFRIEYCRPEWKSRIGRLRLTRPFLEK
jgi:hypothetical protein